MDSGQILFNGEKVNIQGIKHAQSLGIGTVFQENSLMPHLSIAENIFLTREPRTKIGAIDYKTMHEQTFKWGKELGLELDPGIRVDKLSVAEQQVVEIVKVFSQDPKLIILDEPTSSLSDNEIEKLFAIIERLKKRGVTFIYISHRMEEIKRIGDGGTILRDGKFITTIEDVKTTPLDEIIAHIVGRPLDQQYPKRNAKIGPVMFEVENLSVRNLIHNVSFNVRAGEVFGISGLVGSGRTETAKAIFGELKKTSGCIRIEGKEVTIKSPHDAIKHGIGLLTENRKGKGSFRTSRYAGTLSRQHWKIKSNGILNFTKERNMSWILSKPCKLGFPYRTEARYLSGGNQQKVVFAKWLNADSKVYIFDEPTRGLTSVPSGDI